MSHKLALKTSLPFSAQHNRMIAYCDFSWLNSKVLGQATALLKLAAFLIKITSEVDLDLWRTKIYLTSYRCRQRGKQINSRQNTPSEGTGLPEMEITVY
jgi:hypothetical protein